MELGARSSAARHRLRPVHSLAAVRVSDGPATPHVAGLSFPASYDSVGITLAAGHWAAVLYKFWLWDGHVRNPILYGPVLCACAR
jgi:hypothetical protein